MNGDTSVTVDVVDSESNRVTNQIKCVEIGSENTSVANDSCSDESESNPNELNMKIENETTNKHSKLIVSFSS